MTVSEEIFEEFCRRAGIKADRISTAEVRQPDYEIFPSGNRVVAEVKHFDPSPEEVEIERRSDQGEMVVGDKSPPGRRVRTAIQSGYDQLKARTGGTRPGLLVLYNNVLLVDHSDPYHLRTGMFGLEKVVFAVPKHFEYSPYSIDRGFGGKRRVTPDQRRSLSAVARLRHSDLGLQPDLFHNPFAAIPLPPEWLPSENCLHYRLAGKEPGQFQEWILC